MIYYKLTQYCNNNGILILFYFVFDNILLKYSVYDPGIAYI